MNSMQNRLHVSPPLDWSTAIMNRRPARPQAVVAALYSANGSSLPPILMTKPPRELIEFLFRHDPAIQSLALGLRHVVLGEMAPCHEYIFAMRSQVVLVYGPTERVLKDAVCMIVVYRQHANLCFTRGIDLEDAGGVLLGSGKAMRHITVKKLSELDRPEIRTLIWQARRRAGLTRPRRPRAADVVTRVKKLKR
jgi:hypothetical protein